MPIDNQAMVKALAAIRDMDEVVPLQQQTMHALALCGIEAAYFVAPLRRDARLESLLTNIGLPRVWERHYRARLYLVDPLPRISLTHGNAFRWPEDVDLEALQSRERRYLKIAAQFGLARGIGVACYGPHGRAGFLGTQWKRETTPADEILLAVHQIGQVSFQSYCRIMREDIDFPPMSNRELEVLRWMCRGKSNPVMAEIIGVSRSSIDAYIRRVFAKLGVKDRTAACVRAYSLGLVTSEGIEELVKRARESDKSSD